MARVRSGSRAKAVVVVVAAVALVAGALLYLRSRGDDGPSTAEAAEQQAKCGRLQNFVSLLGDPALSQATVAPEAAANVVTRMGGDLEPVVDSAPPKVRSDVRTLADGLRGQAGDPAALRAPAFAEARRRLASFVADPENGCQPGTESGDG